MPDQQCHRRADRRRYDGIGVVPFDERVTDADNLGRALIDYAPTAAAVLALDQLANTLIERLGGPVPVGH
jgi:Flp pilus assembly CpaE family ATPase